MVPSTAQFLWLTYLVLFVVQFGQTYDAQVGNIELVEGKYGLAGKFTSESRAALYGMGPHSKGEPISYALWFKTVSNETQILLSYQGWWRKENVAILRLNAGIPELVMTPTQKLVSSNSKNYLNTGEWVHIAISMPFKDCKLSQVKIFINGMEEETTVLGIDENIVFPNGGLLALAGFGYSKIREKEEEYDDDYYDDSVQKERVNHKGMRDGYIGGNRFIGFLDDVFIFSRSLSRKDIRHLMDQTTRSPTISTSPSASNSNEPSQTPSTSPTIKQSYVPSVSPSITSTISSSSHPTIELSDALTSFPSVTLQMKKQSFPPSTLPSASNSNEPSQTPSTSPTINQSYVPSVSPSITSTISSSSHPTIELSDALTNFPSETSQMKKQSFPPSTLPTHGQFKPSMEKSSSNIPSPSHALFSLLLFTLYI